MSRADKFEAVVGAVGVHIDYGTPRFFLAVPDQIPAWDLVRALRLVADLGFQAIDLREYAPARDAEGGLCIELERTTC